MDIVPEGSLPWLLWASYSLGQLVIVWAVWGGSFPRKRPPSPRNQPKPKRDRSNKGRLRKQ
jgi:hypothetical protein